MSRVGRLLLWTKAPRSLRHFNTLCRAPGQSQQRLLREILGRNADTEFGRPQLAYSFLRHAGLSVS
jgi:hypothetical protein